MPQLDQLSACPGCGEPLNDRSRVCGRCGADLEAARADGGRTAVRTPTEPDFRLQPPDPRPMAAASPRDPSPDPAPARHHRADPRPATPPGTPARSRPESPAPAPAPVLPQAPAHTRAPDQSSAQPRTPDRGHPPAAAGPSAPAAGKSARAGAADGPPDPRTAPPEAARPEAAPAAPASPALCAACGTGVPGPDGACPGCAPAGSGTPDHAEQALEGLAAVSDVGSRHHRNEDAFAISATALPDGSPAVIAVVCDGVSSSDRPHEASAAAARAASRSLLGSLPRGTGGKEAMHEALMDAARAVNDLAGGPRTPGKNAPACTVVSAVAAGGVLTVGWVGDSRAYWVPLDAGDAAAARLTEDDSWAAQMVAAGLMNEAEAMADRRAHAITAWLGADAQDVEPHTQSFAPDRPGVVVVCTDGLWNYAESAAEMARVVPADSRTAPLSGARELVRYALHSGGHDNVTVAVVPWPLAAGAPAGPAASGAGDGQP
ncbi:protein phosphatase 2C domain-containing protein [Streptomyces sodiiphilus]